MLVCHKIVYSLVSALMEHGCSDNVMRRFVNVAHIMHIHVLITCVKTSNFSHLKYMTRVIFQKPYYEAPLRQKEVCF